MVRRLYASALLYSVVRIFIIFIGLFLFTTNAFAQLCNFTLPGIAFSGSTVPGASINGMTTVRADCSGLLSLGRKVLICPNIGAGSAGAISDARKLVGGGSTLFYQLYQDAARSIVWGSPTWPYAGRAPGFLVEFTNILSPVLGGGTTTIALYGKVLPNQGTAPAGTYISTFASADAPFRFRYDDGAGCAAAVGTLGSPPTFTFTAIVPKDCLVSAEINVFGTHGVLSGNVDATGKISVSCSPTVAYTVSLSNGSTGTGLPRAR